MYIELHTGTFTDAQGADAVMHECDRLHRAAEYAVKNGLKVNAGHGLNYDNVTDILDLAGLEELNIGHSIICRSVYTGLAAAVRDMCRLLEKK